MSTRTNSLWVSLAVAALLIVGLALRLYNLNWDDNHHLHPDERFITTVALVTVLPAQLSDVLDPRKSPLNPYWDQGSQQPRRFAYGSFPLYLVRMTATTVSMIGALVPPLVEWAQANDYDHINLVGRAMSAIFDTITIWLIFLLGRRIFNEKVGLIAAALVTFTVQNIQLAHFYAFDTVTTTTIVAALYFGVRVVQDGEVGDSLALGAMVALAVASKFSALPLLLVIVLAHGLRPILSISAARPQRPAGALGAVAHPPLILTGEVSLEINRAVGRIVLSMLMALLVFIIVSPFTFLDFTGYASSISEQSEMVRGILDYPYTRQYRNTGLDYWFNNLVFWGMGPALGITALAGLALVIVRLVKRTATSAEILILAWVLPYGVITLAFQVKFLRYLLPVTPFLCLTAAYVLWRVASFDRLRMRSGEWRVPLGAIANYIFRFAPVTLVLGATIAYAFAFMNIYSEPVTRVRASDWIYRNIPRGATITDEVWDDSLPLGQLVDGKGRSLSEYKVVDMNLVEQDDATKLKNIRTWLTAANYVILSSNRMYGWLPRLEARFPITNRYYELLFAGKLGFEQVADFATRPTIGPLVLNDDHSDESFTVYDHPRVLIFHKVKTLSADEFNALFADTPPAQNPTSSTPVVIAPSRDKTLLLDRPVDELPAVNDRAWNVLAAEWQPLAVVSWWLVVELLGLLALPLTLTVFRHYADGGYIIAKSLGLLLVGYIVWILASMHLVMQTALLVWGVTLVLLAFAVVWLFRARKTLLSFIWQHKGIMLFEEVLFGGAFLLFVLIRILDPDLWQPWNGGEKSMEFAFLNAILKSPYFPPYDPYFAGGYINYYYYGLYLVGVLIKLTGVASEVAFNLAIPTLFAFTIVNAFSIAFNLSGPVMRATLAKVPERLTMRTVAVAAAMGLLASLFIAMLGNLDGFVQIVEGLGKAASNTFHSGLIGVDGIVQAYTGTIAVLFDGKPLPLFDYWRSSRVIPFTINEFPLWSFLFADLHPHMIGIPFTLVSIALAGHSLMASRKANVVAVPGTELDGRGELATPLGADSLHTRTMGIYATPAPDERPQQSIGARLAFWLVLALTLGAIAAINTWDAPTYLGLGLGAVLLGRYWQPGSTRSDWLRTLIAVIVTGALSTLLYLPFFSNYKALYVGLGLSDLHTDFQPFVIIWGLFLFIGLTYLIGEIHRRTRDNSPARVVQVALRHAMRLPRALELVEVLAPAASPLHGLLEMAAAAIFLLVLLSAGLLALNLPTLALLVWPFSLSALLLMRRNLTPRVAFMNWIAFWAFAILLGVEVVYLQDFLGGEWKRMNTLFKFYIQAWVLLGLLGAMALPELWTRMNRARILLGGLWQSVALLMIGAALIFTFAGTAARVNDRFPTARPPIGTLDGLAFMDVSTYNWPDDKRPIVMQYDLDAIHWLQDNIVGTPVIAEAAIGYYREGGMRVSSYTGLPTLLGMHQGEQRYSDDVGKRDGEARDFYNTPDSARAMDLIRELHIDYIYVGQLEQVTYDAAGLAKFDVMMKAGVLEMAYQNPMVKIYRVRG